MFGNAPALTPFERVHQSIAGIPGVPSDPRLHYRKMLNEAWMGHSRKLPQGWETFPQIPVTHPEAHLPHPFGTESYPKIHMESLRDYSIRCNHPASYQEKLRVAVESQLEWIKRYPKIQGDTLSPEQIQNGCGKRPSKESADPIKICIVTRSLDDIPTDWNRLVQSMEVNIAPLLMRDATQPFEIKVIHMGVLEDLPKTEDEVNRIELAYSQMEDQSDLIFITGGPTVDPIFVTNFIKGNYTKGRAWLGSMTFVNLPSHKVASYPSWKVLKDLCNWAEEGPKLETVNPMFIYFVHYFFEEVLRRQMIDALSSEPTFTLPDDYFLTHQWIG